MPRKPTGICIVSWCGKGSNGKYCQNHWGLFYKYGTPTPAEIAHSGKSRYRIRLIAKTCTKCGELKDAERYQNRGRKVTWCNRCVNTKPKNKRYRYPERQRAAAQVYFDKKQGATLPLATNWGKRWGMEEEKVAMATDKTIEEKALLLGRSWKAVEDRIYLIQNR